MKKDFYVEYICINLITGKALLIFRESGLQRWFLTEICGKSSIFLLILLTFDLLETKQSKFC